MNKFALLLVSLLTACTYKVDLSNPFHRANAEMCSQLGGERVSLYSDGLGEPDWFCWDSNGNMIASWPKLTHKNYSGAVGFK